MGWEPGWGGEPGGVPDQGVPGGGAPARDPRLAGFAADGEWDTCPPSAALATALEGASGPDWRCPGASRDEMTGLLRRWTAMEAWAAAGRLGVLRALIRDEGQPLPGGGWHGDLPGGWTRSLTHEVAAAVAVSVQTAEAMMWLAWDLRVRLPGIAALLAGGSLACSKARAVSDAFGLLSGQDAARAEAMILPELPGKNYGQVKRLAEQAAVTVDPGSAARRREHAERERSRVRMFREDSGAAALSGRDLPAGQALAAHARVCARAQEYKDSGAFPGTRTDQLRAAAYLDILNGTSTEARIASGTLPGTGPATGSATGSAASTGEDAGRGEDAGGGQDAGGGTEARSGSPCAGYGPGASGSSPGHDDPGDDDPGHGPEESGPGSKGPGGGPGTGDHPGNEDPGGAPDPGGPDEEEPRTGGGTSSGSPESSHSHSSGCSGPSSSPGSSGSSGSSGSPGSSSSPGCSGSPGSPGSSSCPGSPSSPGSPGTTGPPAPPAPPGRPDGTPGPRASPPPPASPARPPRLTELVLPLATLLGLAERPGEGHGLGPLDPDLCRDLAAAAAASPWTRLCVTVTDPDGIAIGHGCARRPGKREPAAAVSRPPAGAGSVVAPLPARVNLTIPASRIEELARQPSPGGRPGRLPGLGTHPQRRPGTARRLRHLDANPARRQAAGPQPGTGPGVHLRSPARVAGLPAERHAPAPGPDPRRGVHISAVLAARQGKRLRARRPLRKGRTLS